MMQMIIRMMWVPSHEDTGILQNIPNIIHLYHGSY